MQEQKQHLQVTLVAVVEEQIPLEFLVERVMQVQLVVKELFILFLVPIQLMLAAAVVVHILQHHHQQVVPPVVPVVVAQEVQVML
jgi:hypothetical protein